MAHPDVIAAVMARLGAWPDCPVIDEMNTGGDVPDASTFVQVQFPAARVERWAVESRFYRETGGIRFVVNTQRGLGVQEASTVCEQLASLFRDRKFGGVETQAPGSPFFDDDNDNGSFFQASFVAPYTYDYED